MGESTAQTTTQQYPDWWTNYTNGIINTANQIASQPYAPYRQETVAPLTALQKQSMEAAGKLPGAGAGEYTAASEALGRAGAVDISGAGAPGIQEGMGFARKAAGISSVDAAQPYLQRATGMSATGAAQPYVTGAMGALGRAMDINVPGAAQPYMNVAGQLVGGAAENAIPGTYQYMDPFANLVVNRVGELAGRNLSENLLPRIGAQFIGAGQTGSDRAREFAARALRDTQEAALAQQGELLSKGYGQALTAAQADLARRGQLAGTAGQLGATMGTLTSEQQRAVLQAAQQKAALGQTMGQLTTAEQQALMEAGQTAGQLTGADATRQLQVAQELRTSGGALGQLAEAQAASQRAVAAQQMALAQSREQAALDAIKAQMSAGAVGQAQDQANLDATLKSFQEERDYPGKTIDELIRRIAPLAPPTTTYTATNVAQPSTTQNILGTVGALRTLTDPNIKIGSTK